jgi:hypothetical protein
MLRPNTQCLPAYPENRTATPSDTAIYASYRRTRRGSVTRNVVTVNAADHYLQIHPVDIYRFWDDMDKVADRAHRDVPWDFVQPFLESHDYHLREKIPGSSADRVRSFASLCLPDG